MRPSLSPDQDAVRGDYVEISKLLIDHGAKIHEDGKVRSSVRCMQASQWRWWQEAMERLDWCLQ